MPLYPNSASPLALNAKLPADKPKWFWTSPIVSTSPIGLARLFAFSRTCLGKMANGEWQNIVPGSGILSIVTRNHLWLCSASILIYHVLCPSAWLRRFNNATQPIVELHTWFWVSISSPCSITHGLTQTATLNIFCHVAALHIIHNGNPYTWYHDTLATHHPSKRKMAYQSRLLLVPPGIWLPVCRELTCPSSSLGFSCW